MDKSLPDDRRRYFRISDSLGVAYRVVGDDHLGERVVKPEPVSVFQLLQEQDAVINQLLGQLHKREPLLAELGQVLNQKINCIVNQLEMESRMIEQIAHKIYEVNISACGLGFRVDEAISLGANVQLDLVLLPESRRILTDAVVVGCDPLPEGQYVRMNFVNIHPRDQELLIQHIVKRQGDLLRNAREQAEQVHLPVTSELLPAENAPPAAPDEQPPKSSGV